MSSTSNDFPAKLVYQPVLGFIEQVASKSPAPGGGSAAALSGAVGAGLLTMVTNFTIGKKNYAAVSDDFVKIRERTEELRHRLSRLIDDDTAAFNRYRVASKLPEADEAEKTKKAAELAAATQEAIDVPTQTMHACLEAVGYAAEIAQNGNVNTVSDAGVGAEMLVAGLRGAAFNVLINLASLSPDAAAKHRAEVESALTKGEALLAQVREIVNGKLHG